MEFSTTDLYPDRNNKVRTLVVWLGIMLVSCILVRFFDYVFKIFHHWRTSRSSELVYHGSEMYLLQHNPRDDFVDKEDLDDLDRLVAKSLWHQLTLKLLDIVKADVFRGETAAKHLYDKYIKPWQEKMNPLLLAEMLLYVVSEYSDPKEAIEVLEKTESVVKKSNLALSLCKVTRASTMLDQGDVEGAKKLMKQLESLLDVADQTTFVHGLYHKLCCKWHRQQGNHADAYRAAFRYLGCTELHTIPIEQQEDLALLMIESGLAGEDVYDLGHLISHPILDSLTDLPENWHLELLQAVNDGNSVQVDVLMPRIESNTVLSKHVDLIRRKTHLLSLMQNSSPEGSGLPGDGRRRQSQKDIPNTAEACFKIPVTAKQSSVFFTVALEAEPPSGCCNCRGRFSKVRIHCALHDHAEDWKATATGGDIPKSEGSTEICRTPRNESSRPGTYSRTHRPGGRHLRRRVGSATCHK